MDEQKLIESVVTALGPGAAVLNLLGRCEQEHMVVVNQLADARRTIERLQARIAELESSQHDTNGEDREHAMAGNSNRFPTS